MNPRTPKSEPSFVHAEENDRSIPQGSSHLKLTHAAIITRRLEAAVEFYQDVLGLDVRVIEEDPIRKGRQRAILADTSGEEIIEIIEMSEMSHPTIPGCGGIHHIGFTLPSREWHSLRSRLDAVRYSYQEISGRLFVRDVDGLVLEIELR